VPKFSSFKSKPSPAAEASHTPPADATAVPKFSSFKAKPAPSAEASRPPSDATAKPASEDKAKSKSRSSRHHGDAHRDRPSKRRAEHPPDQIPDRRRRHRTGSPPESDRALVRLEKKPEPEAPKEEPDLFFLDRRGDPLISRYHANDRAKVPLYRRSGRGRVLGSPGFLVLHREGKLDEFSIRLPGSRPSALRDHHLFDAAIRRRKPRRIKPAPPGQEPPTGEEDFVPLSSKTGRHDPGEAPPSLPEDQGPDYRSIEGKAKAHEFSDSELEYSSDEETTGIDLSDPIRKRSVELSRQVKEHPDDIDAWLSLIDHQDTLLRATEGVGGEPTQAEVLSYADIKLSMYESAIQHAKTPEQQERLQLGILLEGAKVWSSSKLERRWEEALKMHKSSFVLWRARLDLRLSTVKTFQYQDIKDMLLDRLQQTLAQTSHPSTPHPGATMTDSQVACHEQLVYIFLRLTRFIFDSGFRELAVAAWQALLELNLFRPPGLADAADGDIPASFRDFWESEAPRIGEDNARGWAHFAQAAGEVDPPDPRTEEIEIVTSRDMYKSWGATERLRTIACRHPARAMDEGNDDDPYRVVIFSDVEKLLFLIPGRVDPLVHEALVDGFLLFCDLPLLFGSSEWLKAAATDSHIVARSLDLELDVTVNDAPLDPMEDQSKRQPEWSHEASHLTPSPDILISKDTWYRYFSGWVTRDKHQGGTVKVQQVLGTLTQLGLTMQQEKLAEYRLALEWYAEPTLIKKRAKGLLRTFPSSRRLYTTYALAEFANGSVDVARQVLTAASAIPGVSEESLVPTSCANDLQTSASSTDILLLWTSRAWMELENGDKTRATICLCAASDPSFGASLGVSEPVIPSSPQLIMVRQTLSSNMGYSFSESRLEEASLLAVALALFEYLTLPGGSESASLLQGNIAAAMDRVWAASGELCTRGASHTASHEGLLQASAKLLYFHASRG
jgi:nuclear exosome regulator NRDE2